MSLCSLSGGTVHEHSPGRNVVRSSIDAIKGGYLVTGGVQMQQDPAPSYEQTLTVTPGSSFRFLDVPPGTPVPSSDFTTLMEMVPHVYLITGAASTQAVSVISTTNGATYPVVGGNNGGGRRLLDSGSSFRRKLANVVGPPSTGHYKIAQLEVQKGASLESGNATHYQNIQVQLDGSMDNIHYLTIGHNAVVTFGSFATANHGNTNTYVFEALNISNGGTLIVQDNTTIVVGTLTIGGENDEVVSTLQMLGQCNITARSVHIAAKGHLNGDNAGWRSINARSTDETITNNRYFTYNDIDHKKIMNSANYNTDSDVFKAIEMTNAKKIGGSHGGIGGRPKDTFMTVTQRDANVFSTSEDFNQVEIGLVNNGLAWGVLLDKSTPSDPAVIDLEVCMSHKESATAYAICGPSAGVNIPCKCSMRGYGSYKYPTTKGMPGAMNTRWSQHQVQTTQNGPRRTRSGIAPLCRSRTAKGACGRASSRTRSWWWKRTQVTTTVYAVGP